MLVGYARVSTVDQNLSMQLDDLEKIGCKRIFEDRYGGAGSFRPGLKSALDFLREGDILVVWSLDRLSRSLKELIEIVNLLNERKIGLNCLQEAIDTTSNSGRLVFHIFGALAEFERNLIRERTKAGLAAARARGRMGGRPCALNAEKRSIAVDLYHAKKHTVAQICKIMGISKPTLYKYIAAYNKN